MNKFSVSKIAAVFLAASGLIGCQQPTTTTNVNQNIQPTGNTNINSNFSNANANLEQNRAGGAVVETSEPDKYQANVTLKVEAGGATDDKQKTTALPAISAQVAKSGNNKRMEFSLPNGEKVIYLDKGGQQTMIMPQRKQYADLDKESLGFDIRRMMSPEQMVSQIKALKGVTRVGDESYGGRSAVKYTYGATTNTGTQAGNVATESVIYVDKETNLPLRSETYSQSQSGASVNGLNSLRLVTEMTNLTTTVDENLFSVPADFKKVEPAEVRAQAELVFKVIGAFLQNTMSQVNTGAATPAATVTASPTAK